jgi:hypothetical protein
LPTIDNSIICHSRLCSSDSCTMRTGNSVNSASCAARKRLAPATISYPLLLGRTVMGWISPWVRRLTLSQRFFEQLVEAPVPLDLRAIKALKRSPLSLDLYAWATRRVSYLKRPLNISWASFQLSFGADYAETPQGRSRFRGNAIEALGRVKVVYPQLKIEIQRDGVLLYPSLTHVPKTPLA